MQAGPLMPDYSLGKWAGAQSTADAAEQRQTGPCSSSLGRPLAKFTHMCLRCLEWPLLSAPWRYAIVDFDEGRGSFVRGPFLALFSPTQTQKAEW